MILPLLLRTPSFQTLSEQHCGHCMKAPFTCTTAYFLPTISFALQVSYHYPVAGRLFSAELADIFAGRLQRLHVNGPSFQHLLIFVLRRHPTSIAYVNRPVLFLQRLLYANEEIRMLTLPIFVLTFILIVLWNRNWHRYWRRLRRLSIQSYRRCRSYRLYGSG